MRVQSWSNHLICSSVLTQLCCVVVTFIFVPMLQSIDAYKYKYANTKSAKFTTELKGQQTRNNGVDNDALSML